MEYQGLNFFKAQTEMLTFLKISSIEWGLTREHGFNQSHFLNINRVYNACTLLSDKLIKIRVIKFNKRLADGAITLIKH